MTDVKGKKITVIGAARSGVAAARMLSARGARVFLTDAGEPAPGLPEELKGADVEFEFGGHTSRAMEADIVVVSPGVPSDAPPVHSALQRGIPVNSEVEAASWFCRAPIVAITGTNGKTTTTSLTGHVFAESGRPTIMGGNIGDAFSGVVDDATEEHVVVLEVSSFQLDHIRSFRPRVSVILNITPDHLDRYEGSFDRYARSKLRIFENQRDGDVFIYNHDDEILRKYVLEADRHPGLKVFGLSLKGPIAEGGYVQDGMLTLSMNNNVGAIMETGRLALRGQHNTYNSLAAAMAARVMDVPDEVLRRSLASFAGVPHRLEFVREVGGIRYVNDSKATNVNAVWYALESFDEPIVLIAGGRDKGNDYKPLCDLIAQKVRAVVAIGESADRVLEAFRNDVNNMVSAESMEEAVNLAQRSARTGDVVLLSPACASFDWYANYEERGNHFKEAVHNL
jgi:UDP-N-acetylmuramoylalanine--D-glutamate ligase